MKAENIFGDYLPNLLGSGSTETMIPYVWLLISVTVIGSMAFCIYFTFRNHRELQEVLKLFQGKTSEADEEGEVGYKAIREYANKIIDDNDRFKERMMEYDSLYEGEVLDKMLRNTYANREEMEKALESTDLCIRNEQCLVLCIRYEDAGYRTFVAEGVVLRDLVKEFLAKAIEGKSEILDAG